MRGDGDDGSKNEETTQDGERNTPVRAPQSAITKHKHDAPVPQLSTADEFGLPVRPARRRNFSLDELDSPEDIKQKVIEETGGRVEPTSEPSKEVGNGEPAKLENDQRAEDDVDSPAQPVRSPTSNEQPKSPTSPMSPRSPASPRSKHARGKSSINTVSEWSHQQMAPREEVEEEDGDEEEHWKAMPAFATHRIYDDWGKVLAQEYGEVEDEQFSYGNLGGAAKGYTRVQIDEDAQSATSLDDNTAYLFKEPIAGNTLAEEDEEARDLLAQMQTTKELLTEAQRVAYVGVVRLSIAKLAQEMAELEKTKGAKKQVEYATEALKMWGQKMMVRLYKHMDIDSREQIMVEQLAEHGVLPSDLTPALMRNARVKNPKMESAVSSNPVSGRPSTSSQRPSVAIERSDTPSRLEPSSASGQSALPPAYKENIADELPPPVYKEHTADELVIQDPSEIENAKNIDLDIRWTVLCDLFLLLVAESTYDSRSRTLLEHVGSCLSVDWQEIGRFEKRVTDALEMQEQADKENWNEEEHLEARRKAAKKRRMMIMGLCTVGGGLVIGLSAGLLAPIIGAGLAAGFTGIGVAGTSTFLTGTGAAALIGTTGSLVGGSIGVRTSGRRTGAVKTFEYKPLFNNKRVNLIVTVAGWMTGTVDDVRLPFSTINPVMGDIYSVNWEPEMLQSTGQTISILATEALTQTIQQILGATFLAGLMAGLSMPIVLTKISYLIDNPWTVSLARADAAGLIFADSIIDRNLGVRPITLVGFSLGSRVIFSCLKELARRGAVGLVQNVYMFGSPIVAKKDDYIRARSIVSGRFVNGYATNDWILGYLFRATSGGIMRVAGLATVDVHGVENINVTETVPGHMAYRGMMPILLDQVGWEMESYEFSEIEDPDPDNHEKRQRELINEIEEARREMDEQPEKKGFKSFFSRKKNTQKKAWETYDERSTRVLEGDEKESERVAAENANVMFDVDAIRREALALALQNPNDIEDIKKHLSVREIETTLPALKVTLTPEPSPAGSISAGVSSSNEARPNLRQTHSHDPTQMNGTMIHEQEVNGESDLGVSSGDQYTRPSTSPAVPSVHSHASSEHLGMSTDVHSQIADVQHHTPNSWSEYDHDHRDGDHHDDFDPEQEVEMSFE